MGATSMDELDLIWSVAGELGAQGETPEGTPEGVIHLSYLLRLYNSAEGGSLGFAFEVNEEFRVERAIHAMRYFGRLDLADFFENLRGRFPDYDFIESQRDEYYAIVGNGDVIEDAFRTMAVEPPERVWALANTTAPPV